MPKMPKMLFMVWALAVTLASAVEKTDPPGRAARLSYTEGTVSLQPAGVDEWVSAEINRPLTTGDRLWTQSGARAELQIGSADLRLNGQTNTSIINLDDNTAQIEISLGILNVHLRDLGEGEAFEVDTPNLAFSLLRPGDYRIEVSEQANATVLIVWGGQGEATANGQALTVRPREQLRVSGQDQTSFVRGEPQSPDPFDEWCKDRDSREERSLSGKYVSQEAVGFEDLDANGIWRSVQEFGQMWVPSGVAAGWAPYSSGHWVWIEPWGWTWVDNASWGYAPYHYGRWAYVRGTWGWVPGPRGVHTVYSPALVAWRGGITVSMGGPPVVGWLPLGPGEVWVPGYHASRVYFERINRTNTIVNNVHITNVYNSTYLNNNYTNVKYVNEHINGAMTVMPRSAMMTGSSASQAGLHTSTDALSSGQWRHTAPVAPQREAVLGGSPKASSTPPASSMTRSVVAKTSPPPPPIPFSQKQAALQANAGRPLDSHTIGTLQHYAPPSSTPYRAAIPRNMTPPSIGEPRGTGAETSISGHRDAAVSNRSSSPSGSQGRQTQTSGSAQLHSATPSHAMSQSYPASQPQPTAQTHSASPPRPAPHPSPPPRVVTPPRPVTTPPPIVIHH